MAHTINRVLQPCGEFFSRALPIPFGNFYPLAPHPLGISIDHHGGGGGGGGGMDNFWNHTFSI